ncbi:MAG: hypothetical protein ABIJ41_03345 [Candidatus Omnitrophota bacterium]
MRKKIIVIAIWVIFSLAITPWCDAQMVNYKRLKNTNNQTERVVRETKPKVSVPQPVASESTPKWMTTESSVKNRNEKAYDVNRDGRLQSWEAKVLLKDVVAQVDKKGSYVIDSDILKEYDKNRDGTISRSEASLIKTQAK